MQAIVLAGGSTNRLQPVAAKVPKPMLPLFDQPVLEHTLKYLAGHGITDIIICTSGNVASIGDYFGDGSRWGVNLRYSVEHEPKGTAGAVKLISRMVKGTFVVVPGDIVTDIDISEALTRHHASSAIASILLHEVDEPTQYGMVVCNSAEKVTRFVEKPRTGEVPGNTVSTGIYILEPEALSSVPYDEPSDFALQVFPRLINNQEPVYGLDLHGYWCDTGDLLSYHKLHFDALSGHLKLDLRAKQVGDGIWMGERAEIHPSAEVGELVYIGAGATVKRSAALRGRVIIGEGSTIDEGANLWRSVVGSKSYVGSNSFIDSTIIGNGYNISCDERLVSKIMVSDSTYEIKPQQPGLKSKSKPKQRLHQIMDAPVLQ